MLLKKAIGLVPLSALLIACTACERVSFSYYERGPRPVHRRTTHVCTKDCHHHYHDGTRLVVTRGHRHGPGCGHVWNGRYWVPERKTVVYHVHKPKPKPVVVHKHKPVGVHKHKARPGKKFVLKTARPGKYYVYDRRGSKWVKIRKGHVHGPGCGHVYVDGVWCLHVN